MLEIRLDAGNAQQIKARAIRFVAALLGLWLAYRVREIWIPVFLAFLIALMLDPVVDKLEERGWGRAKATLLIFGMFFVLVVGVLALTIPAVVTQTIQISTSLSQYLPSDSESQTKTRLHHLLTRIHANKFVQDQVLHASVQISHAAAHAGTWVGSVATSLASNLIWVALIPIIAFYALKDFHIILARALLLVHHENRSGAQKSLNEISTIFVSYLRGLAIVCGLNGVVTAAIIAFGFHLSNALALGAISGALYMIPYLGPILTSAIVFGVGIMTLSMNAAVTMTLILIFVHSVIFDQIITPRVIGDQVGLHPIFAVLALLAGGALLGVMGMLLAVPVAATIQMIVKVLFPKSAMPIEVPTGKELHAVTDAGSGGQNSEEETTQNVHQTIVDAVDYTDPDTPTPPREAGEHPGRVPEPGV